MLVGERGRHPGSSLRTTAHLIEVSEETAQPQMAEAVIIERTFTHLLHERGFNVHEPARTQYAVNLRDRALGIGQRVYNGLHNDGVDRGVCQRNVVRITHEIRAE